MTNRSMSNGISKTIIRLAVVAMFGTIAAVVVAAPAANRLIENTRYQSLSPEKDKDDWHLRSWHELVGSSVQVEGFAWGAYAKGFGTYVVTENGKVYLPEELPDQEALNGKLVRVRGKLSTKIIKATTAGPNASQGPTNDVFFYTIEDAKVELIEQVKWPWLQVVEQK